MTSMDTWTMVELRAECAKLGITPGRSKPETVTRIMAARAQPGNFGAMVNAAARAAAKTVICATTPGNERAPAFAAPPGAGWVAPRRMSRLARALCGSSALRGTFAAGHPCVYLGAPLTVDIARLVGFEAGIVARSWAPEPCARQWV